MKKLAVLVYHKNALDLYPELWIRQAVDSIEGQSFRDFTILELNYGGGQERFTEGDFFSYELPNHIHAMNALITYAFNEGFEAVANINLDDVNHPRRFEKQFAKIQEGYQIVSSNFRYFGDVEKEMIMTKFGDIGENLRRNHNVIAHPAVMMHRSFWDDDLHYRDLLGFEDLDLWKRAWRKGKKFCILPEILLNYRRHSNQITKDYGINGKK